MDRMCRAAPALAEGARLLKPSAFGLVAEDILFRWPQRVDKIFVDELIDRVIDREGLPPGHLVSRLRDTRDSAGVESSVAAGWGLGPLATTASLIS